MKVIGKTTWDQEMENINMQMEIYIKDNGLKIKNKDQEF